MTRTCAHCLSLIPHGRPAARISGGAWYCAAPACGAAAARARRARIAARGHDACPFAPPKPKGGDR